MSLTLPQPANKLMRQLTMTCLSPKEMRNMLTDKSPLVARHIESLKCPTEKETLIEFTFNVLELTGLLTETNTILSGKQQQLIIKCIDEALKHKLLEKLLDTNAGNIWYGSVLSTNLFSSDIGLQIKKIVQKLKL